jgi:DNA-directed RNA polymerase omega subunit
MSKQRKISMIDPNINELIAACPSKFTAVIVAAKYARTIAASQPLGRVKPMSLALRRLADGDIRPSCNPK